MFVETVQLFDFGPLPKHEIALGTAEAEKM